jgi:hypothetical protein
MLRAIVQFIPVAALIAPGGRRPRPAGPAALRMRLQIERPGGGRFGVMI